MKSYSEIMEILKANIEEVDEFAYGDFNEEKLGLGEIEEVEQKGGEGEGEHWTSVKWFKDHNVYIKVVGYYQSHHGTDFLEGWDSCKEVKPVQRMTTYYEE